MNTLFTNEGVAAIAKRIGDLKPESQRQWGKMNVSQMLAHCQRPLNVGTNGHQLPKYNFFLRFIGRMVKNQMLKDDKPFKQNQPTDASFKIANPGEFEEERKKLIEAIERFSNTGRNNQLIGEHPFFGKLTHQDWDKMSWKHLDHHLRQFAV